MRAGRGGDTSFCLSFRLCSLAYHRSNNLVLYHAVCSDSGSESLHHKMEMTLQVVVSTVFYPESGQSDVRGNYSLQAVPCSLCSQQED